MSFLRFGFLISVELKPPKNSQPECSFLILCAAHHIMKPSTSTAATEITAIGIRTRLKNSVIGWDHIAERPTVCKEAVPEEKNPPVWGITEGSGIEARIDG